MPSQYRCCCRAKGAETATRLKQMLDLQRELEVCVPGQGRGGEIK